jgi:hypothetical protein
VLKQLQIPYSFAKRHGVLLRYEGDQAFIVRRESTPLLALQEARRFLSAAPVFHNHFRQVDGQYRQSVGQQPDSFVSGADIMEYYNRVKEDIKGILGQS